MATVVVVRPIEWAEIHAASREVEINGRKIGPFQLAKILCDTLRGDEVIAKIAADMERDEKNSQNARGRQRRESMLTSLSAMTATLVMAPLAIFLAGMEGLAARVGMQIE